MKRKDAPMHAIVLLLGGLVSGTPEHGQASFRPTPSEGRVPELFRLPAAEFAYVREPIRDEPGYSVSAVRFASPIVTPDPENNTVHAEYFAPRGGGRRPAVVV